MAACSAACAAPGRSCSAQPGLRQRRSGARPTTRAFVSRVWGGRSRGRLAEHLAARDPPLQVGDDLAGHPDLAEADAMRAPGDRLVLLGDGDVGDRARERRVVGVVPCGRGRRRHRGRGRRRGRSRPGGGRRHLRGRCSSPRPGRRSRAAGRCPTPRSGPALPAVPRMSVRSEARRRSVQYQPPGRRRSSPASVSASTACRLLGPNRSKSGSVRGTSEAAAHR